MFSVSKPSDLFCVTLRLTCALFLFSVNNLTSLEDFAHCPSLQELYIRKNHVEDLRDVHYLKKLERLRVLWLSDNPCAQRDNYRMTVLRTLPNLQKLDNVGMFIGQRSSFLVLVRQKRHTIILFGSHSEVHIHIHWSLICSSHCAEMCLM